MVKQKKVWSQLEDHLLKKLYEQDQMRNWSLIAKKMFEEHNTPKKSGKQCRQRYQNHIDTSVVKIQWTRQQQKQLILLHNDIGNKWANIALHLPGKQIQIKERSDNCVKNHFYSKLRKKLRKLNKIIHHYFRRQFRQININVIYKLVQATQQRFKQKPNCSQQVSLKSRQIQNKMLQIAIGNQDEEEIQQEQDTQLYRTMIKQIYSASKQYKRKSKKFRNLSIQAPNVKKSKQQKSKNIVVRQSSKAPSDGYMSDSQHGSLQQDQSQDSISKQKQQNSQEQQYYLKSKMASKVFVVNQQHPKATVQQKKIQVESGKEGIQNMLRQNNILENEFTSNNFGNNYFKFSDKSSFKSYNSDRQSDRDYFNMFQSSDAEQENRRKNSKYVYFSQRPDDNNICFSQKQ